MVNLAFILGLVKEVVEKCDRQRGMNYGNKLGKTQQG